MYTKETIQIEYIICIYMHIHANIFNIEKEVMPFKEIKGEYGFMMVIFNLSTRLYSQLTKIQMAVKDFFVLIHLY